MAGSSRQYPAPRRQAPASVSFWLAIRAGAPEPIMRPQIGATTDAVPEDAGREPDRNRIGAPRHIGRVQVPVGQPEATRSFVPFRPAGLSGRNPYAIRYAS